jgi:hypothetical protein
VADLLPSALTVYASSALVVREFRKAEWTDKIAPVGDLRSATEDSDRWVGVVLPVSRKPKSTQSDAGATPADAQGDLDFRVSYVARVNIAGRFTWPGAIVESSSQFASTQHAPASQIGVAATERPGK